MNSIGSINIEDLTLLQTLDEKSLLEEVQARYKKNKIYVSKY